MEQYLPVLAMLLGVLCLWGTNQVVAPWSTILVILGILLLLGGFFGSGGELDCFVATAVYESSTHPDVLLFKRFRDRILVKTLLGRLIIRVYYLIGPYLAKLVIWLGLKSFIYRQLSIVASLIRQRYKL